MGHSHESTIGGLSFPEGDRNADRRARIFDGTLPKDSPSVVERWKNGPSRIDPYQAGVVLNPDGSAAYRYQAGRRLITTIADVDIEVMDTCEAPWAVATVQQAFAAEPIARLNPSYKLKVLERGAGMNIVGAKVIDYLMQRGSGEYHIIDLNNDVLHNPVWGTYAWRQRTLDRIAEASRNHGIRYDIDIHIHPGEAREVTKDFAKQGKKFNIMIGDTVPLDPSEEGVNDLLDIGVSTQVLHKESVLTFFPYFPGFEHEDEGSHLAARQLGILRPRFGQINVSEARVHPPRSYKYLGGDRIMPVRSLPVVICTGKK